MIFPWSDPLSLRIKATIVVLSVLVLGLGAAATLGLQQTKKTIAADEERTVLAIAKGIGRSAELALAAGDQHELSRLAARSLDDEEIRLVAIYDASGNLLARATRDNMTWNAYTGHRPEQAGMVVGEDNVELSAEFNEFSTDTVGKDSDHAAGGGTPGAKPARFVGRVVVGLSTAPSVLACKQEIRFTVLSTGLVGVLSLALVFILLGAWTRRLGHLLRASERIASGDLTAAVVENRRDEIGRLSAAYERMRGAVQQRDRDLRRFNETLQQQVHDRTQSLEEALHAAQAADQAKSRFLANMSHEIRTPLNGVVGMVDLLRGTNLDENQRRYSQIARTSADSLLTVINDILDFSKIEAGRMELEAVEFDLRGTVEDLAETASLDASKKCIELACNIDPTLPRNLRGDPSRLRQILLNLVNNAIKFTDSGQVVIKIAVSGADAVGCAIQVSVSDTGIGIAPDRREKLFQSFSQVDASTTRKYGGTGLGLAISKRLVELMGGTIGVESEVGRGSTFWFSVILKNSTAKPSPASSLPSGDLRNLRVLAVDDNEVNREIILQHLVAWKLRARAVSDGPKAIEQLRRAATEGTPYDLAILDWHMPGMDGIELARIIRADALIRSTALIMLTSIEDKLCAADLQALGFNGCLLKPVRQSLLFDTIVKSVKHIAAVSLAAGGNPVIAASRSVDAPLPSRKAHVLLAEDNEINQMVASEILSRSGHTFDVVDNGRRAFEAVFTKAYDLVLMDCQMPVMDGLEATRAIRKREQELDRPQRDRICIVALTANAIKGDRELCLAAGMNDYVSKPINPAELHRAIEGAMKNRPPGEPAQNARLMSLPGISTALKAFVRDPSARPEVSPDLDPAKGLQEAGGLPVDVADLTARCMNNVQLAMKMLEKFQNRVAGDVATLAAALRERRMEEAERLAHGLKGAAATLSATKVRSVAAEIEMFSRGCQVEEALEAVARLAEEAERCVAYIPEAVSQMASRPVSQQA